MYVIIATILSFAVLDVSNSLHTVCYNLAPMHCVWVYSKDNADLIDDQVSSLACVSSIA